MTEAKKPEPYTVLEDGVIHGIWNKKGAKLALTTAQAQMFLAHGRIAAVKSEPKKA